MQKLLQIHPDNPQLKRVKKVSDTIQQGGIIAYPTDSGYALGCAIANKSGLMRIRAIRQLSKHHHFTLMLPDFSAIGEYAMLNNVNFRLLKSILPGAYTFILPATKDVPNRLLHDKRKTIGVRISSHGFVQALLAHLDTPLMSVTLIQPDMEFYDIKHIIDAVGARVDLVIDCGYCPSTPTTVIDLSGDKPVILRQGAGKIPI